MNIYKNYIYGIVLVSLCAKYARKYDKLRRQGNLPKGLM